MAKWAKEFVSFGINRSGMGAGEMDFAIPLHSTPPTVEQMRELSHLMMTAHGILMDRIRRHHDKAEREGGQA